FRQLVELNQQIFSLKRLLPDRICLNLYKSKLVRQRAKRSASTAFKRLSGKSVVLLQSIMSLVRCLSSRDTCSHNQKADRDFLIIPRKHSQFGPRLAHLLAFW